MKSIMVFVYLSMMIGGIGNATELQPLVQAKLDVEIIKISQFAAQPVVVNAVKKYNANASSEARAMTQTKWQNLQDTDPFIVGLGTNSVAKMMKSEMSELISEAFVCGADGTKVAFIAKPTNWNHTGKAKHDIPMSGKVWQGEVEKDVSSGASQIQLSVPVLDGDRPIGSLVVGVNISKLSQGRTAR